MCRFTILKNVDCQCSYSMMEKSLHDFCMQAIFKDLMASIKVKQQGSYLDILCAYLQKDFIQQISHFGFRASQTALPCNTMR